MGAAQARRTASGPSGAAAHDGLAGGVRAAQRERMLDAAVRSVYEDGAAAVTVAQVVARAVVSRKTFYETFESCEDCLSSGFEDAVARARMRAAPAYAAGRSWAARTRGGLLALLEFFDEHPGLARLCIRDSDCAGPRAIEHRTYVLGELARLVDGGRELARSEPPPLTAEGVVGGVLALLQAHQRQPHGPPLTELLNRLMAFIVLPYLGSAAARRELAHTPAPAPKAACRELLPHPLEGLNMRLTYRTIRVLASIAENPGASNMQVSRLAGIGDQGQISKLMARLARLGLVENASGEYTPGAPNEWRLTQRGTELDHQLRRGRNTSEI